MEGVQSQEVVVWKRSITCYLQLPPMDSLCSLRHPAWKGLNPRLLVWKGLITCYLQFSSTLVPSGIKPISHGKEGVNKRYLQLFTGPRDPTAPVQHLDGLIHCRSVIQHGIGIKAISYGKEGVNNHYDSPQVAMGH